MLKIDEDALYTRQDLAELLERTPRTVNRMYADGLPKHMMRGRNYTFGHELIKWITKENAPDSQVNPKLIKFRQGIG